MTIAIANVSLQNTFGHWMQRTNELAFAMSTSVITVNSNTTVGNATLQGTFTANVINTQQLTGPGTLTIVSTNAIIDTTATLQTVGTMHVSGSLIIDTISKVQIPGANGITNFLCANTTTGNLYFAEVLIPIGQLIDVTDVAANTKNNQSILQWSTTSNTWTVQSIGSISQTHIGNLQVDLITSPLIVSNTASIGNTLFITAGGRVGVACTAPRTTVDIAGVLWATGDVSGFQTSDETQKENVITINPEDALDMLMATRPVTFDWREDNVSEFRAPWAIGHDAGVIAQEWEQIFPDHVTQRPDGTKAVDYKKAIPYLIAAVKYLGSQLGSK
jgi:hypothetical protein